MGHLILEEIPIYDDGGSTTNDVKDVTAVQIEMKAVSKVKYQLFLFLRKPVLQTTNAVKRDPGQIQPLLGHKNLVESIP